MSNPPGLVSLSARIEQVLPLSNNVGISGNPDTHHFGYHMSPNWLLTDPRSDYGANDASLHGPLNAGFNKDYASAIDTAYNAQPSLIQTVSTRMRAAIKARDPRLLHNGEWVIAEAAGTLDGNVTWARYTDTQRETFGEWDDSHLSHNHWSIYRKFCNNYAALQGIADVMAGKPLEQELVMDAEVKAAFDALNARLDRLPAKVWLAEPAPKSYPGSSAAQIIAGTAKTVKADLAIDKEDLAADGPTP